MSASDSTPWQRFVRLTVTTAIGVLVFTVLTLIIVNPYRNLTFGLWQNAPLTDINQRWQYPALAREARFDSAVFGTSTIRLLRPELLDKAIGGHFAQLAMNASTAWEQRELAKVYLRHHPAPKTIILGIDERWCEIGKAAPVYTYRGFPEWMYDENPWNDLLPIFNGHSLELAFRAVRAKLGLGKPHYDDRGWGNFLPFFGQFDIIKTRRKIYGQDTPKPIVAPASPSPSAAQRGAWTYPTHETLKEFLGAIPDETRKILVIVPFHLYKQGHPDSTEHARFDECKRRVAAIAAEYPHSWMIDFMISSPLTTSDENYWDDIHYTLAVADGLVGDIATALDPATPPVVANRPYRIIVRDSQPTGILP